MALYEFQCKKCGRKTEVIQLFSDPAPTKCPHCGGALAKLLSSPAFQFKGSGFYSTDYGKSAGKPEDS
jgi:putative FmdB family regulatory protein